MKKKTDNNYWWSKIKIDLIKSSLFSNSGTEVGVSNNTIKLLEKNGNFTLHNTKNLSVPKEAYEFSPDLNVNYPTLNKFVFGKLPKNWLVGNYKKIFIGYHSDNQIRRNGSSGGIVSGIQLYSIQKKYADHVITLGMRKDKPYLTEPLITNNIDTIKSCSQSKYTVAPVNQILSSITTKHKSIVYTGLPHEIAAIRKLQMANNKQVKPMKLMLGLFYGETLNFSSIESVLKTHGNRSVKDITKLSYREGEWPGNLKIEFKTSDPIIIRKMHANYLIPSHITDFSLFQVDFMSELADISVGDAWAPKYEDRGKGWSVVIARSDEGLRLLERMRKDKVINLSEISVNELIEMHSHGLDLKKRGSFLRIQKRLKSGLNAPDYGYEPVNIPLKRKIFEHFLGYMFILFKNKVFISILEKLPNRLMGNFFIIIRDLWKKLTKSSKKGGLKDLRFKIYNDRFDNIFTYRDVKKFWDKVAVVYEPANNSVGYVHYQRFEKAMEYGNFKKGQKILNVWSRTGKLLQYLRKVSGLTITNLEASPKMISIAKRNFPDENFNVTNLTNFSTLKNNTFDRVVSLETLEHTPKPFSFLKEIHRVLKRDGVLIMSLPPSGFETPTKIYDRFFLNHGEGPHKFLDSKDVKHLLNKAGFELIQHSSHFILPISNDFLSRKVESILNKIFKGTFIEEYAVRHFYVAKKYE